MALLCLLAACNGGGGNTPPPPLVFAKTGPVQETHGDNPFTNSATGGSGPITYSSSNPAVAIVGANTGTVTITGAGSATMTANAAASSQQASYSLVVVKASQSITLSSTATLDVVVGLSEAAPVSSSKGPGPLAFTSNNPTVISVNATTGAVLALDTWIGTSNTLATAVPADAGAGFYRSTSSTCVLASYAACPNGQFDVLAASAITDTAVTTSRDGFYWIQYGANVAGPSPLAAGTFPPRAYPGMAALNGRLFMVGGYDLAGIVGQRLNDVWSSVDGRVWTQAAAAAAFPARQSFSLITFNGHLWLIGGSDASGPNNGGYTNDVWSSTDGVSWMQATAAAAFSERTGFQSVVFNDLLWVIGGYAASATDNDVWSSADGVTWTQATAVAPFTARSARQALVLNNQLCIVAGNDGTRTHDMWCSPDGIQWRVAAKAIVQF